LRHACAVVTTIEGQVFLSVPNPISKMRVAPANGSLNLFSIRIEKKLVMIESVSVLGIERAMDAIPVQLPRPRFRQISVPDHVGLLGKRYALGLPFASGVVQAEFDFLGVFRIK